MAIAWLKYWNIKGLYLLIKITIKAFFSIKTSLLKVKKVFAALLALFYW